MGDIEKNTPKEQEEQPSAATNSAPAAAPITAPADAPNSAPTVAPESVAAPAQITAPAGTPAEQPAKTPDDTNTEPRENEKVAERLESPKADEPPGNAEPPTPPDNTETRSIANWRDFAAFFILGVTNNFGYVLMLSAAHELILHFNKQLTAFVYNPDPSKRECNYFLTSSIFLACILPFSLVKLILPFAPWWLQVRVAVAIFLNIFGLILISFAPEFWVVLLGASLTSAGCGIGELTFLSYTNHYHRNVISMWSCGTGLAGVAGASTYVGLKSMGVSLRNTFLISLTMPALEAGAFWFLMRHPSNKNSSVPKVEQVEMTCQQKIKYIRQMMIYAVPLAYVYFFEYYINLGLLEFIYYPDADITHDAQFRWFQFCYHLGVFIARSSVNIYHVPHIWIFTCLQAIVFIYFLSDTFYCYTHQIAVTLMMIVFEGIFGGASYVNTYFRMSFDIPLNEQQFAISVVLQSDAWGTSLAAALAIPTHNAICNTELRKR